jgi:hypothetical protein
MNSTLELGDRAIASLTVPESIQNPGVLVGFG